MPSLPLLKAVGLNFSPNQLETSPGSMVEASDVIIRRENVIESRRGFSLYGTTLGASTDRCKQLLSYKNKIIRHFSNRLQYENGLNNDGIVSFFDFSEITPGAASPPYTQQSEVTEAQPGLRIKSIEANSNLYFTTSDGIKKISAKSADGFGSSLIEMSGGVKALDAQGFLNVSIGDKSSFLPSDSGVAYKIVWGTKDASGNLILGSPSDPVTVINSLLDLTLKDFSNFILQIDNAVSSSSPSSLISDNDYYSSLFLPITASSVELRANLIKLAEKLDKDLLFATDSGSGAAYNPLNISAASVSSGGATVSFSAGTPANYFIAGDKILIPADPATATLGFTSNGVSIDALNTDQIITSVGASDITFVVKDYNVSNSIGVSGTATAIGQVPAQGTGTCIITSSSHGLKNNQKVIISGSNSVPSINGTYVITYLSKDTFSIDLKQSFSVTGPSTSVSCANHGYVAGDTVSFSSGSPAPVSAGTTYYVISAGLTTNEFSVSTVIGGAAVSFPASGSGFVAKVVSAGSAATWDVSIDSLSGTSTARIESFLFRGIEQPVEQGVPATNAELVSLGEYYSTILLNLQEFISARGNNIMLDSSYAAYLKGINATSNASVTLKIAIPPRVAGYPSSLNPYFYQVYRTSIASVSGVSSVSDLSIIQEYTQIEEKFPSATELSTKEVVFVDNSPESIAGTGANLYTNERSGEGGAQANEPPPFALDINQFKNHTFYSSTRTRQFFTATLLGVANMINNFDILNPYKLTIADEFQSSTYTFVTGKTQTTRLVCASASNVNSSGPSSYFLISSSDNETDYYVWFQAGSSTDPAIANKTGIQVPLLLTDNALAVAKKTAAAVGNVLSDFFTQISDVTLTVSSITPSTGVINSPAHGLSNGDQVIFSSLGEIPRLSSGEELLQTYYIINTALNSFQISEVSGGAPLTFSTAGSGVISASRIASGDTILIKTIEAGNSTNASFLVTPSGFSISTIQSGRGEDATSKQVLLSPNASVGIAIEETVKSLIRVINKNANELVNAFYISGTNQTPGTFYLQEKTLSASTFYLLANSSIIGESFNPDLSPSANLITGISAASPTVITSAGHGLLNGDKIVITDSDSVPSINGVYEISWLSANTFSVPVAVTGGGSKGRFKSLASAEGSSNEDQPHRVYWSKYQQPEAVPIANFVDVGATDKRILRVFPLRDSLFVFKEDGLYRISGEVAPFSLALFDSSCVLIAPDSISVANNQIYGWTTQGISVITEAGVSVISRPIDTEILKRASSQYVAFKNATWGVGYESDNSYTVYTVDSPLDDSGEIGFRYSNLTNSWTTVAKSATCGMVNPSDDRLYLGSGITNRLERERKDFTRYDYSDWEYDFSLASGSIVGNTITLSNVNDLSAGDVIVQDQTLTVFEFNALLKKLDLDPGVPSSDYYSSLSAIQGADLREKLVDLANKLDSELTTGYAALIQSSLGSVSLAKIGNPCVIQTSVPHNLQTGRVVAISGNSQVDVNGVFSVTVTSATEFTIQVNTLVSGSGGAFVTLNDDFNDIKTCYNLIINKLNSDIIVAFANYRPIDNNTVQEAIINSINVPLKQVTINLTLDFVLGPIKIYKAIPCRFTFSPLTMGDALGLKHLREATMMFSNKAFTRAAMEFSTDLLPEIVEVPFNGDGNGVFGHSPFGGGFFGGGSNSAPFRTYIPRQCQRCRFINVGFSHNVAREQFAIYGITLTGEVGQSTRAYR